MESIFEFLLEMAIQILADVIADWAGVRRTSVTSAIGSILLSALLGVALAGITFAVHPQHIIKDKSVRIVALVVMPVVNGLLVALVGRWLASRGKKRSGFEYFPPGFVFSLAFGLTRSGAA